MKYRWTTSLVFLSLVVALLALNFQQVFALEDGGFVKREKEIRLNKSYEIFIGNGGVFVDNSQHNGTLIVKASEPLNRGWQVFTQRILDVRILDEEGQEYDRLLGLVRVFFNLDGYQRVKWLNPASNMSIWVFDEVDGGWSKCKTRLVEASSAFPKGRLYCYAKANGIYGLAWTKPTIIMKLEKAKAAK